MDSSANMCTQALTACASPCPPQLCLHSTSDKGIRGWEEGCSALPSTHALWCHCQLSLEESRAPGDPHSGGLCGTSWPGVAAIDWYRWCKTVPKMLSRGLTCSSFCCPVFCLQHDYTQSATESLNP